VLSGFVIANAALPGLGLRGYLHHRVACIYPVVLGAGALSLLLSALGAQPMQFAGARGSDALDVGLNVTFLTQTWCNVEMPYNGPFLVAELEVWYYILFGRWCYRRSRVLLLACAVLAGPRVLLLLPVWLLGVWLQRRMPVLDRRTAL
jgi:peptidoglycan/LPS O-acetylase OafA/YrhL